MMHIKNDAIYVHVQLVIILPPVHTFQYWHRLLHILLQRHSYRKETACQQ